MGGEAGDRAFIRDIYWKPWDAPGCEHVRVARRGTGTKASVVADGLVLLYRDGRALRCHYRLEADRHWRTRKLSLAVQEGTAGSGGHESSLSLASDGKGRWRQDGRRVPELDGCLDLDIQVTPLTNTLPIRRLGLEPGEIGDTRVVYLPVPELTPFPAEQSYACLRPLEAAGGLFRYESLTSGYSADLPVDSDGFVVDYPDTFRRIW